MVKEITLQDMTGKSGPAVRQCSFPESQQTEYIIRIVDCCHAIESKIRQCRRKFSMTERERLEKYLCSLNVYMSCMYIRKTAVKSMELEMVRKR